MMLSFRMGLDWSFAVMPYGAKWQERRRLLHAHVRSSAAVAYQPVQLASARGLVVDLLLAEHNMNVLPDMIRTNFGTTTMKMVYGIDIKSCEDEYITIPEKVLHAVSEAVIPGRFLVDALPICMWFLRMSMPSATISLLIWHQ
jgi:cytochrome P450